ncbi:MAG TPA: rod shape-determining protein MreC [Acidimicrobiales bacterium]|nr:rod shape-determining protein MreC [Acidimicrobiales bacterium]
MAVYRRSARPRFTLVLLVLTALTLLTLDERTGGTGVIGAVRDGARDAFAPVQDAAESVFRPVEDFFQSALHYGDLEAENARLREQLAERRAALLRAEDADRERRALLAQQDLEFAGDIPAVSARVVSASISNFELVMEIDRGTDHGVAAGMPVVTGSGLVGRVTDTSRTRSTVLLITDPTSSVGVRVAESGDVGVAVGRGPRSSLRVDLIEPETKLQKGDVLVTSGLDQSVFPPQIPVGTVVASGAAVGALQQDLTLEPVVDLDRLSFVKVLQWSPRP